MIERIINNKSGRRSEACSKHDPNSLDILWVLNNFDTDSKSALVSSTGEDLVACFVSKHVIYHAVNITVSKLDGEGFESVAFWYVMLNSFLELFTSKLSSTNAFILIVSQSCGQ